MEIGTLWSFQLIPAVCDQLVYVYIDLYYRFYVWLYYEKDNQKLELYEFNGDYCVTLFLSKTKKVDTYIQYTTGLAFFKSMLSFFQPDGSKVLGDLFEQICYSLIWL